MLTNIDCILKLFFHKKFIIRVRRLAFYFNGYKQIACIKRRTLKYKYGVLRVCAKTFAWKYVCDFCFIIHLLFLFMMNKIFVKLLKNKTLQFIAMHIPHF